MRVVQIDHTGGDAPRAQRTDFEVDATVHHFFDSARFAYTQSKMPTPNALAIFTINI
jgi:hypothetical protein